MRGSLILVAFAGLAAVACDRPVQAGSARSDDSARPVAPLTVDSILPSGEALRRFQSQLPRVRALGGSIPGRDELVARFIGAIETADNAGLEGLLVSKSEYAFLYFPTSAYSRKPYELPPEIAWLLSEQNSRKGSTRITRRLGGKGLELRGYECSSPVTEGENRFWRSCQVGYTDPTTDLPVTKKLFGAIMERDGRYKFLSYANDF